MTEFPTAPLDRPTRTVTVAVLGLVLGVMALTGFTAEDPTNRALSVGLGALILLLAWGYAPGVLVVDGRVLHVRRRLFGRRRFTVAGRVHRPTWQVGLRSVRKLGSGGLFGWYGVFWRAGVGSFHAYVTDRSRSVLCETDAGPVIVSPADPDAFEAALREGAS